MREIKFRAWDKNNVRFILPENLVYRLDGHLFDREFDVELYHVELMQFTGLLDKNGKEIFELEILNKKTTFENNMADKRFQPATQINVGFEWGCFIDKNTGVVLYDIMRTISSFDVTVWTEYEIIGNELENPELL